MHAQRPWSKNARQKPVEIDNPFEGITARSPSKLERMLSEDLDEVLSGPGSAALQTKLAFTPPALFQTERPIPNRALDKQRWNESPPQSVKSEPNKDRQSDTTGGFSFDPVPAPEQGKPALLIPRQIPAHSQSAQQEQTSYFFDDFDEPEHTQSTSLHRPKG